MEDGKNTYEEEDKEQSAVKSLKEVWSAMRETTEQAARANRERNEWTAHRGNSMLVKISCRL